MNEGYAMTLGASLKLIICLGMKSKKVDTHSEQETSVYQKKIKIFELQKKLDDSDDNREIRIIVSFLSVLF